MAPWTRPSTAVALVEEFGKGKGRAGLREGGRERMGNGGGKRGKEREWKRKGVTEGNG